MSRTDLEKIKAGREQLEIELQQRRAARVQAGEAVAVDAVAVVGVREAADAAVKALKAKKLAEMKEAGDARELLFVGQRTKEDEPVYDTEPLVIITGVPRAGRDDDEAVARHNS